MAVLGALGDLVLALSADTARFQSDLGRAERVAAKFGKEVGRTLGNLAGMLVALGGAAGFGALVRGQINAADAALLMSQKLGMSTEAWSMYMVAGRLADVTNEQLQTGFQQLAKNQADFVAGTGEAADAFRALGIEQEQLRALNGDTAAIFDLVAGKLSAFEDGANKTAIAMKIFGRSGAELIPLINELEQTKNEASALNAIIDKDTAAAADRFNDNMTRVGISVQAVGLHVAKAVLPSLEKLSERLLGLAKDADAMDKAGRIASTGLKLLATAGTIVGSVFKIVGESVGSVAAAVVLASQGKFREAWAALKEGGSDMAAEVNGAITSLRETWDDTARVIYSESPATAKKLAAPALISAEMVKKAMEAQRDAIQRVHDDAMAGIAADEEITRRKVKEMEEAAALGERVLKNEIDFIEDDTFYQRQQRIRDDAKATRDIAKDLGLTFTSAFEEAVIAGGDLSEILKGLEQDIARIILRKTVSEPMANAVGSLIASYMGGGSTSQLSAPSKRAGGGPVDAGMPYIVGEQGPEMFVPHSSGNIVPNGAGGGITINQSLHVDARSDQASIVMAMRQAKDEAVAEIQRIQQRRGDSRI